MLRISRWPIGLGALLIFVAGGLAGLGTGFGAGLTASPGRLPSLGDYIGAINRFRTVVEQYQKTSQIAEALERLTEAYYALGVFNEAKTAAAVLGANYPGSPWYKDAYDLLQGRHLKPEIDQGSWMSRILG